MDILSLVNALPGAAAQGLIWGIMAIGVYLTFRILDIADLTVDGTMCTGGAVCIMMLMSGHNIWISMLAATVRAKSLFSRCSRVGFTTSWPSTRPIYTPAMGPFQGISEMEMAMEVPIIPAISGLQS